MARKVQNPGFQSTTRSCQAGRNQHRNATDEIENPKAVPRSSAGALSATIVASTTALRLSKMLLIISPLQPGKNSRYDAFKSNSGVRYNLPKMWRPAAGDNADGCVPVFLRVYGLRSHATTQGRGLLRFLFIRQCDMPVNAGSSKYLLQVMARSTRNAGQ